MTGRADVLLCSEILLLALCGLQVMARTSFANLETFAIFAFMIAWVCMFVTACPVSNQMCISARLRTSAVLVSLVTYLLLLLLDQK